jgi:hypothetical protein
MVANQLKIITCYKEANPLNISNNLFAYCQQFRPLKSS